MKEKEPCTPCCDYCKHYRDDSNGLPKRNFFKGIGVCDKLKQQVCACDSCDDFKCAICET